MTDENGFAAPTDDRFFDDYLPGSVHEFGAILVSEDEIIEFGQRFDPLPFHTDPEAARRTEYGGLIASGWHTAALMMRLYSERYLSRVATLVSPGVDELRWLVHVRPGDRLRIRVTVRDARPSHSKPDRGVVHSFVEALNQDGQVVMTLEAVNFFLRRERSG